MVTHGFRPFTEPGGDCCLPRANSTCQDPGILASFRGEIPPCLRAQGKDHQGMRRFQGAERL